MTADADKHYYVNMKPRMMKDLDKTLKLARQVLGQHFSEPQIDKLLDESRCEYAAIIPQLPYIGGKKNSNTANLVAGAWSLAIIWPLEREGLTTRAIGKVMYESMELFFESRPRFVRWLMGKLMISKFFVKKTIKKIIDSPFRHYPGGWVAEFVEGDGENFDLGVDYIECGICTFYKEQGAEKYIPYLCLGDYPLFRSLGIGFTRTQTIGNGDPICDFRFKKGVTTPRGWPPENLEEFKAKKEMHDAEENNDYQI